MMNIDHILKVKQVLFNKINKLISHLDYWILNKIKLSINKI